MMTAIARHNDPGDIAIAAAMVAMFVFGVLVGKDKGQPR